MKKEGTGLALGIAFGVAIGAALGNIAIGIAIGLALGIAYDAENKRKNKVKEKQEGGEKEAADANAVGNPAQMEEKRKHLDEILVYARAKESITNDEIEKLLSVSDATAERYLNELEKEGKLQQVGKTGKSVFYKVL